MKNLQNELAQVLLEAHHKFLVEHNGESWHHFLARDVVKHLTEKVAPLAGAWIETNLLIKKITHILRHEDFESVPEGWCIISHKDVE